MTDADTVVCPVWRIALSHMNKHISTGGSEVHWLLSERHRIKDKLLIQQCWQNTQKGWNELVTQRWDDFNVDRPFSPPQTSLEIKRYALETQTEMNKTIC